MLLLNFAIRRVLVGTAKRETRGPITTVLCSRRNSLILCSYILLNGFVVVWKCWQLAEFGLHDQLPLHSLIRVHVVVEMGLRFGEVQVVKLILGFGLVSYFRLVSVCCLISVF